MIRALQKKNEELKAALSQATSERDEWQQRATEIYAEYQTLADAIRQGEFIRAKRVRVCQ